MYVERHFKNIKKEGKQSLINPINHSRSAHSSLTIPLPTSTHLRIMSWNVEGLKEVAKYDSILRFFTTHISLLCAQEAKVESSITFVKTAGKYLCLVSPLRNTMELDFLSLPL